MNELYLSVSGKNISFYKGMYIYSYYNGRKRIVKFIGFMEACKIITELYYKNMQYKYAIQMYNNGTLFKKDKWGGAQYAVAESLKSDYKKLSEALQLF